MTIDTLNKIEDSNKIDVENFNTNLTGQLTKVFVPNKSGHNFSSAEKYGDLVYVTTGLLNRFAVGYQARWWARALKSSIKEDYLMITSLTILTVIGAAIFGYLHGRINLLIYRNNKYIARTIIFSQLFETDKEDSQ